MIWSLFYIIGNVLCLVLSDHYVCNVLANKNTRSHYEAYHKMNNTLQLITCVMFCEIQERFQKIMKNKTKQNKHI